MSNKIGWCDITINPITGCLNGCDYCYARRMACRQAGRNGYPGLGHSFDPTFHQDKIKDIYNLPKAHKRVFLDSMGDWFSEGVDPAWIESAITAIKARPDHTFLVLTKRPDMITEFMGGIYKVPNNLWLGASVTEQTDTWRINELSVIPCHRFVSFEPLHGQITKDLSSIHWVIIGAESGNRRGKIAVHKGWIEDLVQAAAIRNIPVFMKDNIKELYHHDPWNFLRQFPEGIA